MTMNDRDARMRRPVATREAVAVSAPDVSMMRRLARIALPYGLPRGLPRRLPVGLPVGLMAAALVTVPLVTPAFAADEGKITPLTIVVATPPQVEPMIQGLLESERHAAGGTVRFEIRHSDSLNALRQLCQPPDGVAPRVAFTTRPMPVSMSKACKTMAAGTLNAVELGREAIVLAVRADATINSLKTSDVYHALARDTAAGDEFRRNVAIRWSDVGSGLPQQDIRFQLPPRSDHRRQLFDALVMESGCRGEDLIKGIFEASQRTARCTTIRIDRVREIAREHAVRSLLEAPAGTIGVLSYHDVAESDGKLMAITLNGVQPTPLAIQEGTYGFASSHFMYALRGPDPGTGALDQDREIAHLISLAESEEIIGPNGLVTRGNLVPLPADERDLQRSTQAALEEPYGLNWALGWTTSLVTGTWNALSYAFSDLRTKAEPDPVDLAKLMDTAGYKLAEFESSVGLIPGASMLFKISREMSESDRDFLERELYKDSRARKSIRSVLQRRLIQTIIDISESEGFQVSKVDVTLLPLPKVDLTISPKGSGGSDSTAVLRAIERLQERLPEVLR